jgi:SPP1 gp7 family putative phage head morphogenesis protein
MIKKLISYFFDKKDKPPKHYIQLKGVEPSFAIGNSYRVELSKFTNAMLDDVINAVLAEYGKDENRIIEILSDSLINDIYELITIKFSHWEMVFNIQSTKLATNFVNHVDVNVKYHLKRNAAPLKTVSQSKYDEFKIKISQDTKNIILAKEAVIKDNINLITNIPEKTAEQIHRVVMEASSRGRDKTFLEEELLKIKGMTKNRVKLIARDQLNKVTSVINAVKQAELGIKQNIWKHSKASKEPRKSHVQADGKVYDIDKGCLIDGKYIYPGELVNCRCFAASVINLE